MGYAIEHARAGSPISVRPQPRVIAVPASPGSVEYRRRRMTRPANWRLEVERRAQRADANDVDAERGLVAVSLGPSRTKGHKDPAEWMRSTKAPPVSTQRPGWAPSSSGSPSGCADRMHHPPAPRKEPGHVTARVVIHPLAGTGLRRVHMDGTVIKETGGREGIRRTWTAQGEAEAPRARPDRTTDTAERGQDLQRGAAEHPARGVGEFAELPLRTAGLSSWCEPNAPLLSTPGSRRGQGCCPPLTDRCWGARGLAGSCCPARARRRQYAERPDSVPVGPLRASCARSAEVRQRFRNW